MTESRWPNEYDQNMWTWPKYVNMNKICEHDQKFNNDEHKHGELDQNLTQRRTLPCEYDRK